MKTFLQRRLFACVLAAGLVATGCTFTTDAPDRDAAKAPSTGGSLRVAITEPATIDPSNASNSVSPGDRSALLVLNQICEPLVSADVATGELKPGAAESWSISSDAKKVTFKLRKGLKFHSGRAVTAADYVFSISRFVHKTTGSPQRFWLDRVVGYNDVAAGRKTTLAGVKAPDAETLVVETSQPFAELPSVLAMVTAGAAAPKQAADKPEFAARPDCTGPYKMSAPWRKGTDKTIRLERVEGYAGSSEGMFEEGKGFVDEIVFTIVGSLQAGFGLLEKGEVDVAEIPIGDGLTRARSQPGRLERATNGFISYLGLPVKTAPYSNEDFRQALGLSVDRLSIVDGLLAGSRLLPPGPVPDSAGPAGNTSCAQMPPRGDGIKALAALRDSSIDPAKTTSELFFNSGGGHEKWVDRVAAQWKGTLGISTALKPTGGSGADAFKRYVDTLAEGKVKGPFRLAWQVSYPSPEAFLRPLLSTGSLDNYTGYSSSAFDALLRRASSTADDRQRKEVFAEALQLVCKDMPLIVMWFGASHWGFGDSVASGGPRVDVLGYPTLRSLGVRQ